MSKSLLAKNRLTCFFDLEFWLFETSENRITIDKSFDAGPSEEAMLSCDYYFTIEDTISGECGVSHGNYCMR
jgi:hypothetical protein